MLGLQHFERPAGLGTQIQLKENADAVPTPTMGTNGVNAVGVRGRDFQPVG